MNTTLWVLQALVGLLFLVVGYMKAFTPLDKLAQSFTWVPDFPPAFVRFIGISEILGAIGMIIPPLTQILPWLAIAAAVGLILAAGSGAVVHILRGEASKIGINIVLIVLCAFIIYGRVALAPF